MMPRLSYKISVQVKIFELIKSPQWYLVHETETYMYKKLNYSAVDLQNSVLENYLIYATIKQFSEIFNSLILFK